AAGDDPGARRRREAHPRLRPHRPRRQAPRDRRADAAPRRHEGRSCRACPARGARARAGARGRARAATLARPRRQAHRAGFGGAYVIEELVARAHEFAERELRPVALAYDESETFPQAELRRAAELGLTSYDLPQQYGGGGVTGLADSIRVLEELTWGDSPI